MEHTHAHAPPLDPEVGSVWDEISRVVFDGSGPRIDETTLALARRLQLVDRASLLRDHDVVEGVEEVPHDGVTLALSIFTPPNAAASAPGLFWIHGGGMVSGDRYDAAEALDTASAVGAVVASIEYRLAPEHPAPVPHDDCLAGLRFFVAHATRLGVDPERVVVGGASAGGGLAASVTLRAAEQGAPSLAGLFLCSPMLDDRMTSCSANQFGDDVLWSRRNNEFGWRSLLGDRCGGTDVAPFEAPGRARDLAGLPPTYVDVGSADLFRDEDAAFASTIWACGGDAELHVWAGGYHGSELLVPDAVLSRDMVAARRRWLVRVMARHEPGDGRVGRG